MLATDSAEGHNCHQYIHTCQPPLNVCFYIAANEQWKKAPRIGVRQKCGKSSAADKKKTSTNKRQQRCTEPAAATPKGERNTYLYMGNAYAHGKTVVGVHCILKQALRAAASNLNNNMK